MDPQLIIQTVDDDDDLNQRRVPKDDDDDLKRVPNDDDSKRGEMLRYAILRR